MRLWSGVSATFHHSLCGRRCDSQDRLAEEERNNREGRPGDVDFQRMIDTYRLEEAGTAKPVRARGIVSVVLPFTLKYTRVVQHAEPTSTRITIVVRKRPVSSKEVARHDFDVVRIWRLFALESIGRSLHVLPPSWFA